MIIKPTIDQLSKGQYNRYTLVQATAKGARIITEEYTHQREAAERMIASKETDKSISNLIGKEYCDSKAVSLSVNMINDGEFTIKNAPRIDGTTKE